MKRVVIFLALALTGCSSSRDDVRKKIRDGAIKVLEHLDYDDSPSMPNEKGRDYWGELDWKRH